MVSRRPDAIFHPQFFADDGSLWYPQAYMLGWFRALFHPQTGYFQTLPRLTAALALLVPLRYAPLLENVIAIGLQVLPVNILLSERCRGYGSLELRAVLAAIYIALPNSYEVDASMVNAQWHVALIACLILFGTKPRTLAWRIFDFSLALVFGLTGPFVILLLPLGLIFWYVRRERWTLVLSTVLAVCAVVQAGAIWMTSSSARPQMHLAPSASLFLQILAGHVYLGALLGMHGFEGQRLIVLITVAISATALIIYCLWKAPLEWKLLVVFCFLTLAAALKNPTVAPPQWPNLAKSPGIRYWFLPTLAFAWVLVWGAVGTRQRFVRAVSALGLITMCYGIVQDWRYPAFPNFGFRNYARRFAAAPAGAMFSIPVPPGGDWMMRITKHAPHCKTLPQGGIEQPPPDYAVAKSVWVTGWVFQDQQLRELTIYIDRGHPQPIPIAAHAAVAHIQKWTVMVDLSGQSPGRHEIEVRASCANGCAADIGTQVVNVVR